MICKYAEIFCWKNVSRFCSAKATHIFSANNIRILCNESAKTVNEMALNELVKLTTLWTTGPRSLIFGPSCTMHTKPNKDTGTDKLWQLSLKLPLNLFVEDLKSNKSCRIILAAFARTTASLSWSSSHAALNICPISDSNANTTYFPNGWALRSGMLAKILW